MLKVGDKVSVLDDNIDGTIIKILPNNQIVIVTNDGFELSFVSSELIKIEETIPYNFSTTNFSTIKKEKESSIIKNQIKEKKSKKDDFVLEVDLHIEKLVPSVKGMNNYDILNIQIDEAKRKIEFAIKNRIPKMVLIHGVGEGVLKTELDYLLSRYDNITFQDASYHKYGYGATEIYFIKKKSY